jgi:hypothetical protein
MRDPSRSGSGQAHRGTLASRPAPFGTEQLPGRSVPVRAGRAQRRAVFRSTPAPAAMDRSPSSSLNHRRGTSFDLDCRYSLNATGHAFPCGWIPDELVYGRRWRIRGGPMIVAADFLETRLGERPATQPIGSDERNSVTCSRAIRAVSGGGSIMEGQTPIPFPGGTRTLRRLASDWAGLTHGR